MLTKKTTYDIWGVLGLHSIKMSEAADVNRDTLVYLHIKQKS